MNHGNQKWRRNNDPTISTAIPYYNYMVFIFTISCFNDRDGGVMKNKMRWLGSRPWLLSLVLVTAVFVPGFIRMQQLTNKVDDTVICVEEWADKSTARSSVLVRASQRRFDALDQLIRTAYFSPEDKELLFQRLADYVKVSNEYIKAATANPVPDSPKLVCH